VGAEEREDANWDEMAAGGWLVHALQEPKIRRAKKPYPLKLKNSVLHLKVWPSALH
jgi:hypothetical protein